MVKKIPKIAALILLAGLQTHSVIFAGNGANLIGLTPESAGRGGVGIGTYVGIESLTKNPAMLSQATGFESMFGSNVILLDASTRVVQGASDTGTVDSQSKKFIVPEMGFVTPVSDRMAFGFGLFGTSGVGVDYRNENASLSDTRLFLMALKAVPGMSYKMGKFTAGASAHLGYGILDLAGILPSDILDVDTYKQRGGGVAESFAIGYQLGASYEACKYATVGITYQSDMAYKFQRAFDFNRDDTYDDFNVTMPKELGVGVSSKLGKWELSADIKQIYWSEAEGFKQFRLDDQTVYGVGAQYTVIPNKFKLRFGYNYSPSALKNRKDLSIANGTMTLGNGTFLDSNIAFFDMVGLGPIIAGESITLGAGYSLTKNLVLNGSIEYVVARSITQSGKATAVSADDTSVSYKSTSKGAIVSTSISWLF